MGSKKSRSNFFARRLVASKPSKSISVEIFSQAAIGTPVALRHSANPQDSRRPKRLREPFEVNRREIIHVERGLA
jgi:hypothetical protein